jgi:hypothetical protein
MNQFASCSVGIAVSVLCALLPAGLPAATDPPNADGILPTGLGEAIDRDVERARAATARFKTLDGAVEAGYPRDVAQCVQHQPHGAMGFHHQNNALMDTKLEIDRPEVLTYERAPGGAYELTGVEYLVPISAWTKDEPPTIMGQKLKRAPSLGIWYLHVWIWKQNPSGLFADWNPSIKC